MPRSGSRSSTSDIRPLLALLLLVNLATALYQLPVNRVIERRLCREHYAQHDPSKVGRDGSVPEELCKVDEVQRGLAWIQGIMETAWVVGDFVMTIPLGFAAEKYGRRLVLTLNLVPRVLLLLWPVVVGFFENAFPTRVIVAAAFLSVLGGDCVFNSLVYSLASGLTDDAVVRSTYFGYMSSISYIVALLGPALASASMSLILWLPFFIGIALLLLAAAAIIRLPSQGSTDFSDADSARPLISSPLLKASDADSSTLASIRNRFDTLKTIVSTHPRNFSLLLMSFLLTSLASSDTKLLVQYISKRYGWTFAFAGYLLSGKAVVNFVLLALVIPRLLRARLQHQSRSSIDRLTLQHAMLCVAVSVLGALAIAASATAWLLVSSLLIYALGSALPVFTYSLLKSPAICPTREEGGGTETQIYSIVMLVKTLGSLIGAPLMAGLWIRGIALGGAALGLPYAVSGVCYLVAVPILRAISVD